MIFVYNIYVQVDIDQWFIMTWKNKRILNLGINFPSFKL